MKTSSKWTQLSNNNETELYGQCIGHQNDNIYSIGGHFSEIENSTNKVYKMGLTLINQFLDRNDRNNQSNYFTEWTEVGTISSPVMCIGTSSVQLGSTFYMLSPGVQGQMFAFDLLSEREINQNTFASSMASNTINPCVVHNYTHLFSIGYFNFEIYDRLNNEWSFGPNPNIARYLIQCSYNEYFNSIIVTGGRDYYSSSITYNEIEIYDLDRNEWYVIDGARLSRNPRLAGVMLNFFYPSEDYITMIFGSIRTEDDTSLMSRNEILYIDAFWINDTTTTSSGTGTATGTGTGTSTGTTSDDGNTNDVYLELDFANIGNAYRDDISVNFDVSFDDGVPFVGVYHVSPATSISTDSNEVVYLFVMNYVLKIDVDIVNRTYGNDFSTSYWKYITVKNNNVSDFGSVYISNNTIFEEAGRSNDVSSEWTIDLSAFKNSNKHDVDDHIYENETLSFEWQRSQFMRISGTISKFDFESHFIEKEPVDGSNETRYIDAEVYPNDETLVDTMYSYCSSPVPNKYSFNIYSQWVDSGLNSAYSKKTQGMWTGRVCIVC